MGELTFEKISVLFTWQLAQMHSIASPVIKIALISGKIDSIFKLVVQQKDRKFRES